MIAAYSHPLGMKKHKAKSYCHLLMVYTINIEKTEIIECTNRLDYQGMNQKHVFPTQLFLGSGPQCLVSSNICIAHAH